MTDSIAQQTTVPEQAKNFFEEHYSAEDPFFDQRRAALNRFLEIGMPTRKMEQWKYTPLHRFLDKDKPWFGKSVEEKWEGSDPIFTDESCYTIVLSAGWYDADASRLPGNGAITIEDIEPGNWEVPNPYNDPLAEMNTALVDHGIQIRIADGSILEKPLRIVRTSGTDDHQFHPGRIHLHVGDNAQAAIVLAHSERSLPGSLDHLVCTGYAGQNAHVDWYNLQDTEGDGLHMLYGWWDIQRSSVLNVHTYTLQGSFNRNDLNIRINGEGAEAHFYGLYFPGGDDFVDTRTLVDHAVPNCLSNELYKGIMDGQSTAVFNGKIIVRPDAQKTNAFQHNPNILLSADATVNAKPQLEIFADDVKCSHGATCGALDETALFYLRSRGLGKQDSRNLLTYAFAAELLHLIKVPALKSYLTKRLESRLNIVF